MEKNPHKLVFLKFIAILTFREKMHKEKQFVIKEKMKLRHDFSKVND